MVVVLSVVEWFVVVRVLKLCWFWVWFVIWEGGRGIDGGGGSCGGFAGLVLGVSYLESLLVGSWERDL